MFATFHMKSGRDITVEVEYIEVTRSQYEDQVSRYSLRYPETYAGPRIQTLMLGQIEAVTTSDKRPK